MALLLTFCSGLFFGLGSIVYKFVNNKNRFNLMSVACAFVVIIGLILFDLVPELIEFQKWSNLIYVLLGLITLIVIDRFVPHHHHDHHDNDEEEEEHQEHLNHISIVTVVALLLHNAIEGMALYGVASGSIKSGLLMLLGIGLHNLPFGFQIAGYNKTKKNILLLTLLMLSGFFGGLVFFIFGELSPLVEGIIISLTLGMILHLFVFELLKEVFINIKKKDTIYGIIIGIILLILMKLL